MADSLFKADVQRRDRTVAESVIEDADNGTWRVTAGDVDGEKLVLISASCGEQTAIAPHIAIALAEEVIRVARTLLAPSGLSVTRG